MHILNVRPGLIVSLFGGCSSYFSYNVGVVRLPASGIESAQKKRQVLCTHLGIKEGVLAVARHYPTPAFTVVVL